MTHNIALESEPDPRDMNAIMQGLLAFNSLHTNGETIQHLVVTVRDDGKKVVGGLVGATYLGWLQVHVLFLPEELRGKGLGGTLLAAAEEEAVRRGCRNATLETYSFQSLQFYEKRGYVVFGKLPDMPAGGAKYFLAKTFIGKS